MTASIAAPRGAPSAFLRPVLAIAVVLAACKQAAPPAGPPLEAAALLQQVEKAHAEPQTLSASGKAAVDAPQNGGRYQIQLVLRRPASLRIAALDPLGNPAAHVADLQMVVRINPRLWQIHEYLANHFRQQGDLQQAAWHRQRAVP